MKWQPQKPNTKLIFILPKNTIIKPNFNMAGLKIPIKYQKISDIITTYRFGISIFMVYQIIGYRMTSLICRYLVVYQILKVSNLSLHYCGRDAIGKFCFGMGSLDRIW